MGGGVLKPTLDVEYGSYPACSHFSYKLAENFCCLDPVDNLKRTKNNLRNRPIQRANDRVRVSQTQNLCYSEQISATIREISQCYDF